MIMISVLRPLVTPPQCHYSLTALISSLFFSLVTELIWKLTYYCDSPTHSSASALQWTELNLFSCGLYSYFIAAATLQKGSKELDDIGLWLQLSSFQNIAEGTKSWSRYFSWTRGMHRSGDETHMLSSSDLSFKSHPWFWEDWGKWFSGSAVDLRYLVWTSARLPDILTEFFGFLQSLKTNGGIVTCLLSNPYLLTIGDHLHSLLYVTETASLNPEAGSPYLYMLLSTLPFQQLCVGMLPAASWNYLYSCFMFKRYWNCAN
jgi:hypothetical protein